MPPRANWKGYLRLSLVSCPIALYPASSFSEKVSFNRINRKTGNRLKQQNVDSETGEVVPREDIARGYEIGKGHYLIVEDEEFEAVQVESTRTIEIDQFVSRNEIDDGPRGISNQAGVNALISNREIGSSGYGSWLRRRSLRHQPHTAAIGMGL
jgi:hypothetical protein